MCLEGTFDPFRWLVNLGWLVNDVYWCLSGWLLALHSGVAGSIFGEGDHAIH